MIQKNFTITTEAGLHARPSTVLVSSASSFKSDIFIEYNNKKVNFKSIMGVMSLGVSHNSVVTISADGVDETEALQTIEDTMRKERLGK